MSLKQVQLSYTEGRNLVLTGFMGTGKTAVGRELAARLQRRLLDTDVLVEELTGMKIVEIFRQYGEACFRARESEVIAGLDRFPPGSLVVATGGGAVLKQENMDHLSRHGLIVLLTASPRAILRRTRRGPARPLLENEASPARAVLSLLREREPFYRRHDLAVDTTGRRPSQVAAEIIHRLNLPSKVR